MTAVSPLRAIFLAMSVQQEIVMQLGLSDRSNAAMQKLDAIEAEMRRIGYWSENPPDLLAEIRAGRIRSYLDAPSFELWLQCVFLPEARAAAASNRLPEESEVAVLAMRQYDYHSYVPDAQLLLGLLSEFDAVVEGREPATTGAIAKSW